MKQSLFIIVTILLFVTLFANSQTRMSRKEYIDAYKEIAIREMHRSGIPASITMAQGCLESENGNSPLARKSNNHFGIKCKSDWNGARTYHHDDKLNECFRVYRTVEESYVDHTDFLVENLRYRHLFQLSHKDYDAWAHGLKKAGYATDPKYAERLIKIIRDEELHRLDEVKPGELPEKNLLADKKENEALEKARGKVQQAFDNLVLDPFERREIKQRNNLDIIYVKAGDTYESIAREMNLKLWEIYLYNDLPRDAPQPKTDDYLYIVRKHYIAPKGNDQHILQPGESMHDVAQHYGMTQNSLYRLNRMKKTDRPIVGDPLYLRKMKPKTSVR
ncbi:MAG TPA: glucosaminidase domain-containing protein [Prolixibacteraceae bacterium]|nr:glucosaminidase domain-containing protein [Prolixibacteraceae bacterium]